jgi:signal transduction histidine kinase/CheY-like chemotaxis protein
VRFVTPRWHGSYLVSAMALPSQLWPRSLRGRVLWVYSTALLTSSLALTLILSFQVRNTLQSELQKRGDAKAQALAVQAFHAVRSDDVESLEGWMAPLVAQEDLRFAIVQDQDGQVVAQAGAFDTDLRSVRAQIAARHWGAVESSNFEIASDERTTLAFSVPFLVDEDGSIGIAHIGIAADRTLSQIQRMFWISLGIALIVSLLGCLALLVVVKWMLRPLTRMMQATQAISRGDLDIRLAGEGDYDEVGQLAHAFNEMAGSLATSRAELERRQKMLRRFAGEKAQLLAKARVRAARLEVLNDLTKAMASTLIPEQIHRELQGRLGGVLPYGYLSVVRRDQGPESLRRDFVWVDEPSETLYLRELDPDENQLIQETLTLVEPARLAELSEDAAGPRRLREAGFRSWIRLPLVVNEEPLGALILAFREPEAVDADAHNILLAIAGSLAVVLQNSRLYQELDRSFHELQETQDRLAQAEEARRVDRLRAVGQMASGIAHNFNNILSAIIGRVQLLKLRAERGEFPISDLLANLNVIEQAGMDGAETVRRIQEFSRGGVAEEPVRASLNDLVQNVLEITRPRWKDEPESRGTPIRVDTRFDDLPAVVCVPSQIREALTNLVFNAVDAMPKGGTLSLRTERIGDSAFLYVEDTGQGMTPEVRDRLFDPFFSTKGVKGTGLGLSTVYGIIKRHQGKIEVQSQPGRGTCFSIRLPLATQGAGKQIQEHMMSSRPWKILVADDEANVREVLVELLQLLGHDVVQASGGHEALDVFDTQAFDLVLTDLGMPDLSGWDVVDAIRKKDHRIPVVLATGWGSQIGDTEASCRGVTRVMAKPFTVQKVSSLIAEIQGARAAA